MRSNFTGFAPATTEYYGLHLRSQASSEAMPPKSHETTVRLSSITPKGDPVWFLTDQ